MKRTWLALTVLLASVGLPLLCSGPSQGQSRDPRLWGCMRHELLPIETVPWYDDFPACWTEAKPTEPGEVDASGPAEPLAADVEATVRQAPSGLTSHGSSTCSVTDHADTLCGSQAVHHDRRLDDAAVPVDYYLSGYDPQYDRIVYGIQSVEQADPEVAEGFLPFDGEPESLAEYYVLYGVEPPACECLLAPAVRVYSDSWESSDGCPDSEVRPHQAVAATPHADRTVPALLRALYRAQEIAGRSLRWAVGQCRQYTTDAAVWEEAHCRLVGWWHAWQSEQIEQTAADPSVAEQVEWYEWPPRDRSAIRNPAGDSSRPPRRGSPRTAAAGFPVNRTYEQQR
ncbi:MAG: hypothetical protein KatS3mg110_3349 [Pirellulaceae bacterium]|nr:MAG: hypothetical protein KatS3mg110_3349 [Pirellulaceae bacterium]